METKGRLNALDDIVQKNEEVYAAALKCVFYKTKGDFSGAFCAVLRKHDRRVLELIIWTTKSPSDIKPSISANWRNFSSQISGIGPIDRESSEKLEKAVINKLEAAGTRTLFLGAEEQKTFMASLQVEFENALHYEVGIEAEVETFGKAKLQEAGYERETPEGTDSETKMKDIVIEGLDLTQAIVCTPKIDPINGIAASALKPGDLLDVTISSNTAAGVLVSDYYAKMGIDPILPVSSVTLNELGSYLIVLKVGEDANGVIKATSDLKLKGQQKTEQDGQRVNMTLVISGIMGLLLIVMLVAVIIKILR